MIPFFAFRIMVGMGLVMLAVSWFGNLLRWRGKLESTRWFLWGTFLSFPTGFVAILTGWYTAEVGRQPWVVYGLLRTKDAVTPSLTGGDVLFSLIGYVAGLRVIYLASAPTTSTSCCAKGRAGEATAIAGATGNRPMAFADDAASATGSGVGKRCDRMAAQRPGAVLGRRDRAVDHGLRHPRRLRPGRGHPLRQRRATRRSACR